jgi:hypothetical protein
VVPAGVSLRPYGQLTHVGREGSATGADQRERVREPTQEASFLLTEAGYSRNFRRIITVQSSSSTAWRTFSRKSLSSAAV